MQIILISGAKTNRAHVKVISNEARYTIFAAEPDARLSFGTLRDYNLILLHIHENHND